MIMTKNLLIVGGTSGIGLEVTAQLASTDSRIHLLSRTGQAMQGRNNVAHHICDVSTESPDFPVLNDALDGIAYLPGSITLKPFHLLREENFANDLKVNFFGAIRTLQHYLKNLKKAESASVVLMSTVAVQTGLPYHASIASAKGAVEGLTRSLAAELAPKIRVNAVAPSLTETPLAKTLLNNPEKRQGAAERHPLKRVGTPVDIANAVVFLLSDRSAWMTGQVLHVNGGYSNLRTL